MNSRPDQHDHFLGMVCVIACPAASGLFLALVAALCAYPSAGRHPLAVATRVGLAAFALNAAVIGIAALAAEANARRSRRPDSQLTRYSSRGRANSWPTR